MATVTAVQTAEPNVEVHYVNSNDGENLESRKFANIEAANVNVNQSGTPAPTVIFTGGTYKVSHTGASKLNYSVIMYGH